MKILLVYRDNDLFAAYVPKLIEGFEVVERVVIPQGKAVSSFEQSIYSAANRARNNGAEAWVSDNTCGDIVCLAMKKIGACLDRYFAEQIQLVRSNATVSDNLTWFAHQVVGGKDVKSVIIVTECITDHEFAGKDSDLLPWEKMPEWISENMATCFPTATTQIVGNLQEAMECFDDPYALIILDRHCGLKEIMSEDSGWYHSMHNWPYPAMLYTLPFETCAHQLASQGNVDLNFNIELMRESLRKALQR